MEYVLGEYEGYYSVRQCRTLLSGPRKGITKTVAFVAFRTPQQREAWITEQKACEEKLADFRGVQKAALEKAVKDFINPYKVGDVFCSVWGYDQTNVDWYQAVKVGPRSITFRAICGTLLDAPGCSPMSGYTTPLPGRFAEKSPEITRAIKIYVDYKGIPFHGISLGRQGLTLWDGKAKYTSWYA